MTIEFKELTGLDERGNSRPILALSQDVVRLLETITAVEKAQAVPYLKIWQVDPKTGLPVNERGGRPRSPLSLQIVTPPRFGSSVDEGDNRFRERPPVSLEKVVIKSDSPRGIIVYRTLEISFVVHRPDVVFGDLVDGEDSWTSMLIPGAVHAMEYGWTASIGVRNDLLNGNGFVDRSVVPPIVVPAVNRIRFTVTNYSLKILQDSQFAITVTAYEDGEFNLRHAFLEDDGKGSPEPQRIKVGSVPQELYDDDGSRMVDVLKRRFKEMLSRSSKGKHGQTVSFKELADTLFAPVIERAYRDLGYGTIDLCFGLFNERAGTTSDLYSSMDLSGNSIGSFEFPADEIERTFNELVRSGAQLTLYNFMLPFIRLIRNPQCWNRTFSRKDELGVQLAIIPELIMKTVFNKDHDGKTSAVFYVIDARREYTKFTSDEKNSKLDPGATRSQIRERLREKGVPMISFMKGNSYIQDASFDVINDEQIKAIFMRRYLKPLRDDLIDVSKKRKTNYVDPRQLLYSSSIQGEITMLGNFAFDMFGLAWLDFGVHQWSGPFLVRGREDVVDRGGFLTKISFISEGDDPLGTQGRMDLRVDTR